LIDWLSDVCQAGDVDGTVCGNVTFGAWRLWHHKLCCLLFGNWVLTSLGNSGLYRTVFARNRDTAVPAEGNGALQTLICVLAVRLRWCPTLSNPDKTEWQLISVTLYRWRYCFVADKSWFM